jgi:hypothetical protein
MSVERRMSTLNPPILNPLDYAVISQACARRATVRPA